MRKFGLIGKTLSHSFSKSYFESKFEAEGILDTQYSLFELDSISELPSLIEKESLIGLNVTIPYKEEVISFLDRLDSSAQKVGAVNVIRIDNEIVGYNSDYYGFKSSLEGWLPKSIERALILGSGGSSKAIRAVFRDMGIESSTVSRKQGDYTYDDLRSNDVIADHLLIVNCTPLGMFPDESSCPDILYILNKFSLSI